MEWNKVKAHFIQKGESVASWCRKNDIDAGNFRKIFDGEWKGPKAKILLNKLAEEMKEAA